MGYGIFQGPYVGPLIVYNHYKVGAPYKALKLLN